jgi:hypothetical protein
MKIPAGAVDTVGPQFAALSKPVSSDPDTIRLKSEISLVLGRRVAALETFTVESTITD